MTILPLLHPLHAILGIALLTFIASLLARLTPFYRRELLVEDLTRLTPLDGLRGILCFAVMYCHGAMTHDLLHNDEWRMPPSPFYRLLGEAAVAFFFCITGFLFWSRVLAGNGRLDARDFLRARAFRVGPLYLFAVVVAVAMVVRELDWAAAATYVGLGKMSLLGLRGWGQIGGVDLTLLNAGVTWTLPYEWAFYLALPAFAPLARGNAARVFLVVAALFVMLGKGPYLYFFSGLLAAHAAQHPRLPTLLRHPATTIATLLLLVALPLLTNTAYGWRALLIVTLIFLPLACGNSLFGLLNLAGLRLMGIVSYSVYLLHGFLLTLGQPALLRAAERFGDTALTHWAAIFILACATLAVSLLTYRFIEHPFIQLGKRRRTTPVARPHPAHADVPASGPLAAVLAESR